MKSLNTDKFIVFLQDELNIPFESIQLALGKLGLLPVEYLSFYGSTD